MSRCARHGIAASAFFRAGVRIEYCPECRIDDLNSEVERLTAERESTEAYRISQIEKLRAELAAKTKESEKWLAALDSCETALAIYDSAGTSEHWERHPIEPRVEIPISPELIGMERPTSNTAAETSPTDVKDEGRVS